MQGCLLIQSSIDDDCGCIEEEWDTCVGFMSLHLKPDNCGEVFFDNGDYEWEVEISGASEPEFRVNLESYIRSLPILDDLKQEDA